MKNYKIVSIDDNRNNLFLIESICNEMGLNVKSFTEPLEALLFVLQNSVDMILIDYMMPKLNGLDFIKEYRANNKLVPIVMITAVGDNESIHKKAFELGVNDFLQKPVNAILFQARVLNLLTNYENSILLQDRAKHLEIEVQKATQTLINREHETLMLLGRTAEYKDPETYEHVSRVSHYAKIIAKGYGLNEEEQNILYYAAPFHDLGKVGIADSILLKPGKLTPDEYNIMKTHTQIGYDILKDSKSKYLQTGASIALSHHEKFDGSGYPYGLKGHNINIFGRIVAIADVFDALTTKRPYKEAWELKKANDYLINEKGKHFDPELVDIFLSLQKEILNIHNSIK